LQHTTSSLVVPAPEQLTEFEMDSNLPPLHADGLGADLAHVRQKKYERLVSEAIEQHRYWDMIWAELARDYNAAIANVLFLWRQVDSHFTKEPHTRH
jgi:hypothetical protein